MINIDDLMEMKNEAEKYGGEPHSFVCHPDNYESILKCIESINGKPLVKMRNLRLLGLRILTISSAPKDKIYVLSKDAVDQIKKSIRGRIEKPQDTPLYASLRR